MHLRDVLVRRTSWHYYLEEPETVTEQVAGWMGEILGWDDGRRTKEIAGYGELRKSDFEWRR